MIHFLFGQLQVILSHATHLYFDHPQEPDPEERGLVWARRFISTQKVFSFQPEHIYDNMDEELLGRQIIKSEACTPGGMVDCIPVEKPENIIGDCSILHLIVKSLCVCVCVCVKFIL